MRKKILFTVISFLFISLALLINPVSVQANTSTGDINVVIDQYKLVIFPDQRPYVDKNSRTLVPVRFISEELSATVLWNNDIRQVSIISEGNIIRLTVGSRIASVQNGATEKKITMDSEAVLTSSGRVMVPLRFVSETLGALVIWDEPSKTIFIERIVQNKPSERVLEDFERIDLDLQSRISKKNNYQILKKWEEDEGTRASYGEFVDYILPINNVRLGDTFYFDFNAFNYDNISWISIYFSTDEEHNNYFYYDLTPDIVQRSSQVVVNRKQFGIGSGNPSWASIKYFRIAFEAKPNSSFVIEPKNLITFDESKAMVTLWFDDGWEDTYTNAFRITSRIDPTITGAVGIVSSFLGTHRYLKKEQLTTLYSAGWELVNHSYTHPFLTELNENEIRFEVQQNFSVISEYDPKGAYHFVVPYSATDDRVLRIIKENALSIRHVSEKVDSVLFDRHNLGFMEVTNETDFRTIRNAIDNAIENKQWLGLLFHRIEDPADDRYSFGTQQFEQLIYYLSYRRNDIKVVTPSEAFRESGIPIIID